MNFRKEGRKKNGREESFENIMTGNFPKIMKDYKPHIQETQMWTNISIHFNIDHSQTS